MAKKYKYRHQEMYNNAKIDVRANTLAELADKVSAKKRKIDRQLISPDTRFGDFAKTYIETYKKPSVSETWYEDLLKMSDKIVDSIGNKPVGKIRPLHIQAFLNSMAHYSESYIDKIFDLTCQLFRHAYKNGMTTSDLTLILTRPQGTAPQEGRSLTNYERSVLLKVLENHRGNLFCKIMLYCGLRPGEVAALTWKDIDFKNGIIDVNKARKKNGAVGDPKSKDGFRKIPIPKHFMQELLDNKKSPFDLVCPQANGKPHTTTSRRTMWKNIKRLMNIEMGAQVKRNQLIPPLPLDEDFKMYYLRHTYCTDLEKMGVPINIARQLMGHSSILITSKIYTHASKESVDIARKLIDGDIRVQEGAKATIPQTVEE